MRSPLQGEATASSAGGRGLGAGSIAFHSLSGSTAPYRPAVRPSHGALLFEIVVAVLSRPVVIWKLGA